MKEEENKRTAMISFRVTPMEKERLLGKAAKKGVSLPELGYLAINCIDETNERIEVLQEANTSLLNKVNDLQEVVITALKNSEVINNDNKELKEENSVLKSDKNKLTKDYNTAFEIIKANNLDVVKKEGEKEEAEVDDYFFGGLVKF